MCSKGEQDARMLASSLPTPTTDADIKLHQINHREHLYFALNPNAKSPEDILLLPCHAHHFATLAAHSIPVFAMQLKKGVPDYGL